VLSSIYASSSRIGSDVGRLFSINSFGAVFGSFVVGFFVIPWLGIDDAAFVAGGIYIVVALLFLLRFERSRQLRLRTVGVFVLVTVLAGLAYAGLRKPQHLYNGVFYLATIYEDYVDYEASREEALKHLKYLRHSAYGQIAVFGDDADSMVITNNGKVDASSDPAGRVPRNLLAHIPILLHDDARDVLAIGLGGGWTLAAVVRHDVDAAHVVEINPAVVEANREVLSPFNEQVLDQSAVEVIVSDGRNYLANTDRRYDVVISEPPEIWVSGVSSLFTKEFYADARRAMNPGGILCQWIPRYEMTEPDYKTALNTVKQVFPYVYEFDMQRITGLDSFHEMILIGTDHEISVAEQVALRRFELALSDHPSREHLLQNLDLIEATYVRGTAEVEELLAGFEQVNTDDLPILEFRTLKNRFRKYQ